MTPQPLSDWQTLLMTLALSAGIVATRAIPFLLFSRKDNLPQWVLYLGRTLPHASMTMLLVYCLKDMKPLEYAHGAPEVLGVLFTAGLHVWRKNALLSIAGGTLLYMLLVQRVF